MESRDTIFINARDLTDAVERSTYLARACGSDAALRAEVEAMLQDAPDAANFFEPSERIARSHPVSEGPGSIIGRYKLLQKVGEGGMGVVYMAEQREPVQRKIALKIIKLGMDTRQVVARFEAERQALALMDHADIARVLDAGTTETGRPYFVMDLVQGLPVTQFCDEARLSMRERLDLFLEVCSAIEHAHQKGIIHRDIKPSNILVTLHGEKPVPKIIDFGIAKATQQRLTEKTLFTQFQQFVGTPAYTSPEQASLSGLDIDTRSDIYGLGVLLYELLTGTTPFDAKELVQAGLDGMRRTIQEREPDRPSTKLSTLQGEDLAKAAKHRGVEAPKLIHLIRGDLDWIVMKCLEKDRTRRYDTTSGLAADLKRYLGNEPIAARPPSPAYRARKWVRRNQVQFAAMTTIVLVLIAGSVVSTWQAFRARQAQRAFREQAETARSVKSFLVRELLGGGDAWQGRSFDTNNRVLVERISKAVEGQFASQPLVEAEIRHALGDALSAMDDFVKALSQYEKAFALRKTHLGPAHSDTLLTAGGIGNELYWLGRHREANRVLDEAIATARATTHIATHGAAEVLFTRGWRLYYDGRSEAAMPYLKEALASFTTALGESHSRVSAGRFVVAAATHHLGRLKEAETLFEEGLRDCLRFQGTNHVMAAIFLKGHALLLIQEKRFVEAIEKLESSVAILRQNLGPENQYTLESEGYIADALEKKGDVDGAVVRNRDLHRRWAQHLPYDQARLRVRNLATFFARHKYYDEAKAAFADLRKALTEIPSDKPEDFELLLRSTAALDGWSAAADLCRTNFDQFPDSLWLWLRKAWIFRYVEDGAKYQEIVRRVLALPSSLVNKNEEYVLIDIAGLGSFNFTSAQRAEILKRSEALEATLPNRDRNLQQWSYRAIAQFQLRTGQFQRCLASLEKSISAQTDPDANVLFLKAVCLKHLNRKVEALAALQEGDALVSARGISSESEKFLSLWDLHQLLVAQREAHAEINIP